MSFFLWIIAFVIAALYPEPTTSLPITIWVEAGAVLSSDVLDVETCCDLPLAEESEPEPEPHPEPQKGRPNRSTRAKTAPLLLLLPTSSPYPEEASIDFPIDPRTTPKIERGPPLS